MLCDKQKIYPPLKFSPSKYPFDIDAPNNANVHLLLHDLWGYYTEHEHEMLGWIYSAILDFEIEGFDEKIKRAFDQNLIETEVHGTYEDYLDDGETYKHFEAFENYENLEDYYANLKQVMSRVSSGKSMSIDKHIKYTIRDYENLVGNMMDYLMMQMSEDEFADMMGRDPLDD